MESYLDGEGRLVLPEQARARLGWKAGEVIHLGVEDGVLMAQPADPTTRIKDEARRLASDLRDLAGSAVGALAGKKPSAEPKAGEAAVPPPPPVASGPRAPGGGECAVARDGGLLSPFLGIRPVVPESALVATGSLLIGDVVLGEEATVWPGAVLRGDVAPVRVGARTNVQDGAVLHTSPQLPCLIGAGVTIGHQACIHACSVGDGTLVAIHAVILDGAKVGKQCIIAAGAVVSPGMEIPDRKMVMGVPAKVVRDLTPHELERIQWNADSYVGLASQYTHPTMTDASDVFKPLPERPAPPQRGALPRYECRRAAGPIEIDGALDDAAWAGVPPLSPLVHSDGGGLPAWSTEIRATWDEAQLYVAFSCKDADVWARFQNRDDPLYEEEVVELFLCPTGNLRHYFEIEVSPANVVFDAKVFNPEGQRASMLVDREWNAAGLRSAVRISGKLNDRTTPDLGWIVEVAIPFRDLGLEGPPTPGSVWRANFFRIERGEATEFTAWSPTHRSPADFHVPAAFGELVFLDQEAV